MPRLLARLHPGATLRSYLTATFLNLALVSTILTPSDRQNVALTRVVANERRFRATELVDLGDGESGVLSVPYRSVGLAEN
jgi:hypothetical protein